MRSVHPDATRSSWGAGRVSRALAGASIVVLVAGAVLFGGAWAIGGEDAVSDNAVGATVAAALFAGLGGSLAALVVAVAAGLRHGAWARLWLPLGTFPSVVVVVGLLEALVLE